MVNWNMSRGDLITTLLTIFGRATTARELTSIVSPNNPNQSNLDSELRYMMQQGKIVRTGGEKPDDPYYYYLAIRPSVNYFFVFQNKTYNSEIPGGYMGAPYGNKSHWRSMDDVKMGDVICSCYDQNIVTVGIAKSGCYDSPKPVEFGSDGDHWKNSGRSNTGYLFNFNEAAANVVMTAISNSGKPSSIAGKVTANKNQQKKPVVNKTLQMKIEDFNKHVHYGESEQLALVKQFVSDYTVAKLQKLG
jgi:hypothetical protein